MVTSQFHHWRVNEANIGEYSKSQGLKQISFEVPNPVTVIVGANGIGKSTVLEAIRLVKGVLAKSYNSVDGWMAGPMLQPRSR